MFLILANKAETDEEGAPDWGALLPEKSSCEMVAHYMQPLHNASQGSARAIKKGDIARRPKNQQETSE